MILPQSLLFLRRHLHVPTQYVVRTFAQSAYEFGIGMFEYCLPQFRVLSFDQHLKTHSLFLHSTRHFFNCNRLTLPTGFNSRFTPFDTMQTPSVRRPTGVHRPAVWTCADACHRACSVSGRSEDSHKEWTLHRRTPPEQT